MTDEASWEQIKQDATNFAEQEYTSVVPAAELPKQSHILGAAPQIIYKLGKDSYKWITPTIPAEISVVERSPSLMPLAQRLFLWSFVYGIAPKRYLEIGTDTGGSAMIVMGAILALGVDDFRGVCIDPEFKLDQSMREYLGENFTYIQGKNSPEAMIEAAQSGLFDLILIDGNHTYDHALIDILLATPYLNRGGYLLIDDAAHPQVRDAISYVIENCRLNDCGFVCRHTISYEASVLSGVWQGEDFRSSGLYLLRKPL
ncbi:class I SAM-dependent methyltransferase [Aphanizomenon flos-aquae]|jgi:predicted O-methyltransferase YrrM|uniref:Class I SAM-dependent methyltransferase n=1 Tax=Aphanizomenon flos-aquae FACHB-1040 TaxID=2692887 RepID=A0ABR8C6R2_APHFL|nr:class I SAM-dependent methyltransferase [Aphanizomenon flos-aquae]MBD2281557.1 class I SAM-dependent methyltransferase [Aphanizomenon flos-aquae FACHB-1040]